jgi:hypothetical protein
VSFVRFRAPASGKQYQGRSARKQKKQELPRILEITAFIFPIPHVNYDIDTINKQNKADVNIINGYSYQEKIRLNQTLQNI